MDISSSPQRRTRRGFIGLAAAVAALPWIDRAVAGSSFDLPPAPGSSPGKAYPLYEAASAAVIPSAGYQSRVALGDSIVRLVRHGIIDRGKVFALRLRTEKMPDELSHVLSNPADAPIRLTRENASSYVDLLWPIGLANRMTGNNASPLFGGSLSGYASTAGWTLGDRDEGSSYFNSVPIVDMTSDQEALAIGVAQSTFRPCCDNSTFFQDCNHGSALLAVLQLGAAQGLDEAELYREALAFNCFWFPDSYIRTALYFKILRRTEWRDVDPKEVMGAQYSAQSAWQQTVQVPLQAIPDLIPEPESGADCGA